MTAIRIIFARRHVGTSLRRIRKNICEDKVPAAPVDEGAIYTCPMHPEIEQDHPGSCPKCGMALELPSYRGRTRRRMRNWPK